MTPEDVDALIAEIGHQFFHICYDEPYKHNRHPKMIRIMDADGETFIDIGCFTEEDTLKAAQALCALLNLHGIWGMKFDPNLLSRPLPKCADWPKTGGTE